MESHMGFHVRETSRTASVTDTESRVAVAKGWGRGREESPLRVIKMFWNKIEVMAVQHCQCI